MSKKHGLATFVHEGFGWTLANQSLDRSAVESLCVDVNGVKIVNDYKPSTSRMIPSATPVFPHPCLYAGEFNCQRADWGYNTTSPDGQSLVDWATKSNLALLHNSKDASSLNTGTLVPTQTWPLRARVTSVGKWTDISWKRPLGLNIDYC